MKIIINDKEAQESFTGNSLGEILDQIHGHYVMKGTFFSEILINGEPIEIDSESDEGRQARALDISIVETIEVKIASVQEVAIKNLNNAEDYLNRLIPGIQKAAELFQREDEVEANKFFLNIIDGMEWLSEVLEGAVQVLKLDDDSIEFKGKTLLERRTRLVKLTKQLLDANQNKDWVLVADLLEYEIAPFYIEWNDLLPELKNRVNKKIN